MVWTRKSRRRKAAQTKKTDKKTGKDQGDEIRKEIAAYSMA